MSTLKDRLKSKSRALVRRETVTLPDTGEAVVVRGLTFGENERIAAAKEEKRALMMVALCTEDPTDGQPVWNPNSLEDMEALAALSIPDTQAIIQAADRLSAGNRRASEETASSPTPSSGSESEAAPSPSSASG